MSKEIVAGRLSLRRLFKEHFLKIMDDGRETRSFLPFRKQKEMPAPPPWIFLFHGKDALGKTTAIDYCIAIGNEIASDLKKTIRTIAINWDKTEFAKGSIPEIKIELMDEIAEAFEESGHDVAGFFSAYKKLSSHYKSTSFAIREKLITFKLDALLNTFNTTIDTKDTIDTNAALKKILTEKEYELYTYGEKKCADLLVQGISDSAEEIPILFAIDSYDRLPEELDIWLRYDILGELASRRNKLILFIACQTHLLRKFRNDFGEEEILAINFSDITLTRHTIRHIASKLHVALSDEDAVKIENASAGIPLIIHDILFYMAQGTLTSDLLDDTINDVAAVETLCGSVLSRFLTLCQDSVVRERILSLAMIPVFNARALGELWGIPFSDVKHAIDNIESQSSFIKAHSIHPLLRRKIRSFLIQEATLNTQSSLKPFFSDFSAGNIRIFRDILLQLQTAVSTSDKRCSDQRYLSSIEQLICGMMWSSPTDAFITLLGFYLELLHFNVPGLRKLLSKMSEFKPVFSPVNDKVFKQLITGIGLADIISVFNRLPVKPAEEELIAYMDSIAESMNDLQRALLYHCKAETEIRKGNNTDAMEYLNRSFSLLGNSSPEKSILYNDYVVLGHIFYTNGEHRNSIETFSNAILIKPDGFYTWYIMGMSRMALEEFEGAINAFIEAVKIEQDNAEAWHNLGLSYIKESRHEEAINALTNAANFSPDEPAIWFELGNCYRILNQHTNAIKTLRKTVILQPENYDALVFLGDSCSALGSSEEAIEAYTKAVELRPKSVDPLKSLGMEYFKLNNFKESVTLFSKASRMVKKDDILWCLLAESYLGIDTFDKAIEAGNKALSIKSENARAWSVIGNAHLALENLVEAVDAFYKSVDIEPDHAAIWQKLGTIHTIQNKTDLAIAAFKKAVAFDPSLKEVWYIIGKAYESQEQFADAVASYEKGVKSDPDNVDCWFRKGEVHNKLEQYEDALESFLQVVTKNPASVEGWFNKGRCALEIESFADAATSFGKVVEIDPANAEGWFNLGISYQKQGNHQEAIRSFNEAVAHDESNTDIWYHMGQSCQNSGLFEEAAASFEKCVTLDVGNSNYHKQLGSCYFTLNNFDKAYTTFKKAVELDPENLDTLYQLALTSHSMKNYDEAVSHYSHIIEIHSDNSEAVFNCALAYHAAEKYEKAVELYIGYIKKWPDNGMVYYNLGLAYHASDDVDNAIITYRDAIKHLPENPDVWYNLGIALHTKEQYGDAIQAYRKVLQFMPDHIDAWFNLGMAYFVWQNYTDAIESYANVIKLDAQHYTAWGNIAIAYYALDDYKNGFEASKKAYEINSKEPWLLGNMIVGTLFTGDGLQAQEFSNRLVAIDEKGAITARTIAQIEATFKRNPETAEASSVIATLRKMPGSYSGTPPKFPTEEL